MSLKAILESPKTPKVFFDVRMDSDALYALFGVKLAGIIDLQLMEVASGSWCVHVEFKRALSLCNIQMNGRTVSAEYCHS